jgi:hypothetical protein
MAGDPGGVKEISPRLPSTGTGDTPAARGDSPAFAGILGDPPIDESGFE